MSRFSLLFVAWLTLLIGGWSLDFFQAQRVLGVGAEMLSLVPLLLLRNRSLIIAAGVLTAIALVSPLPFRPHVLQDIEEVEGRILANVMLWGTVVVGVFQERWRRASVLGDVRLNAVIDALPGVIWVGRAGAPSDARGAEWAAFTGQSHDEASGEGWLDAVHADDRVRARTLWFAPDPNAWPDRYDIEIRLWHAPSRRYRSVSMSVRPMRGASGKLLDWVGVITDIDERKRNELALASNVEQLHATQQLARIGTWEVDVPSETVRISAELAEAFGMAPVALEQSLSSALQMFVVDIRGSIEEEIRRLIAEGGERRGEYTVMLEDGTRRVGAITAVSINHEDGSLKLHGTAQDITERVRAAERQRELEAQLFHSAKLQTVGELAAGIAHDFNNVLATVIGFAELARKRLIDRDPQSQAYLERVLEAGRRAGELVRTLMSFARGKAGAELARGNIGDIALAPIVTETLKLVRASVPEGIEIAADVTANINARVERVHLQDALLNLCINARDALGSSGKISVSLTLQEMHDVCTVCGERLRGAAAVLSVRDNGTGVDPSVLPRIFEPFYSTKPEHQGTGMGLAMVSLLMHSGGGHIVVVSRRGDTRFSLIFPGGTHHLGEVATTVTQNVVSTASSPVAVAVVARDRADEVANAVQEPQNAAGLRRRVLVVDDEPSIGRLIASALESYGLSATVFVEPREAAAAYQANPDRWDLLVTDLTMPGMSGLELAGLVREVRWLPVLLLTGGGASDEELRGAGVIDQLMRKPFSMNEFVRATAALLRDIPKREVQNS